MTTMSWNEDLQRTDVKSGPFSQAESEAAKSAAKAYAEVGWVRGCFRVQGRSAGCK